MTTPKDKIRVVRLDSWRTRSRDPRIVKSRRTVYVVERIGNPDQRAALHNIIRLFNK